MVSNLLKKILGDKSSKDRKEYQPIIDEANAKFEALRNVSDDGLREKTKQFQQALKDGTAELEAEVQALKDKTNDPATTIHEKEELFEEIDGLTKKIDTKLEEILATILSEAFAVVKETSRRWAENGKLEVTAEEFDKDLASQKDGITIEGDKATWHNEWTAAGAPVKWNMIHYDVQ